MNILRGFAVVGAVALFVACGARAQTPQVKDAWVRGTVPAQKVTGAFMEINSKQAARLVSAASPVAQAVEMHTMSMAHGVMKMSQVDGIDVPAGKTVKLAPGGYHLMFMGLRQQMKPGERVPLTLTFELADKKRESVALSVAVRDIAGHRMGEK